MQPSGIKRELLLLRHAKSDWSSGASSDFDRPLNARGARDAPRMGRWMVDHSPLPDRILSSPAVRARETALAVARELELAPEAIHWEKAIYEASLATLMEVVQSVPGPVKRLLVVGHCPGLETLALHLAEGRHRPPGVGVGFLKTATLVHLETELEWEALDRGTANLLSVTRPRDIP